MVKVFGYLDDFLVVAYHWLDFIQNEMAHKLVFIVCLMIVVWLLSKFVRK